MGKPRLGVRSVTDWRTKVDPPFLEAALLLKEASLKGNSSDVNAASELFAKCEKIRKQFPTRPHGPPSAADIIYAKAPESWPPTASDRAKGELSWLHWNRFRIPLWQDAIKARFNVEASKRITHTISDYDDRRSNPHWQPKFRIDLDHSAIFELGLTLGLERLTEEELANCFDSVCPCGRTHSADAIRKQRDRLIADLRRALIWEIEVAPKVIQQSKRRSDESG